MGFGAKATSLLAVMLLAAAPAWAESNVAALGRQCNEHRKQSACKELARIALEDGNPEVRYAATRWLVDQALLARIAVGDPDANVRRAAVEKVTDQSLLVSSALDTADAGVASVALGKLRDPSLLADIAAKAKDASVRSAAVGKLADPLILARIALGSKDVEVRSAAAAKLTDSSLLAKIAREDADVSVRSVATLRLTDQSLLGKIAQEDSDAAVRSAAAGKLADPSLLAQIALHDASPQVRRAAVETLTDQSVIQKVAVEDSDTNVRSSAAQRLADRTLLANIARKDKDSAVREAAASALATVQHEHEVYVWRATKADTGLARWKISGILGPSGLTPPFVSSMVVMQNLRELLFGRDWGSSRAPGFEKGWWFAPYDEHPGWVLESGSVSVYDGNGRLELRPGASFRGSILSRGGLEWRGSLRGRPEDSPTLQAVVLYPTSDGTLALGGFGFAPPPSVAVFAMGLANLSLATPVWMPASPAIVTGTIRLPDDKWTEVGCGLTVKGGGLQFDETGVFLIPGTQYNPRDVFLLTANAAVAGRDSDGLAPLFKAAYLGQKDSAASLFANGAEVNAQDEDGRTPLHYAAARGNVGVAQLLLDNHAEINTKDTRGWTALHFAADRGQRQMAELLLAHQADVNARNNDGATALHLAAEHGYKDLAELLLSNQAEVNALDSQRSTPLHLAALNNHIDLTELLRQHGGQPLEDFSGSRPLDPKLAGMIEKIVIVPLVDPRAPISLTFDLHHSKKLLEKKGYQILEADAPRPGDRWVLRFTQIELTRGKEHLVTLYGTLLDNRSGTVSWQAVTDSVYIGSAILAVDEALSNFSKQFPDRPKAK